MIMETLTNFNNPVEMVNFKCDKYGNRTSAVYYFKVNISQRSFLKKLLDLSFPTKSEKEMIRRILRVNLYAEDDISKISELSKIYSNGK